MKIIITRTTAKLVRNLKNVKLGKKITFCKYPKTKVHNAVIVRQKHKSLSHFSHETLQNIRHCSLVCFKTRKQNEKCMSWDVRQIISRNKKKNQRENYRMQCEWKAEKSKTHSGRKGKRPKYLAKNLFSGWWKMNKTETRKKSIKNIWNNSIFNIL